MNSGQSMYSTLASFVLSAATKPLLAHVIQTRFRRIQLRVKALNKVCGTCMALYKIVELEMYSKNKQTSRQPAEDWLPSTPFLMGVSGPSMSGKGVLIHIC